VGVIFSGLILNIGGISLVHFFLAKQMKQMIERMGSLPFWTPYAHLGMRFAIGFGALWVLIATLSRIQNLGGFFRCNTGLLGAYLSGAPGNVVDPGNS